MAWRPSRRALAAAFAGLVLWGVGSAQADPLDSVPPDPAATLVHAEETVQIAPGGVVGADVYVTSRAFLSIDFAVEPQRQVTLMVITAAQKQALDAGQPLPGRPRVRAPIDGVASQSVTVEPGGNYVAILNPNPVPVTVTYRVSARAF